MNRRRWQIHRPTFSHLLQPDFNPRISIDFKTEGMLIPVWSVSKPNKKGECRIVFSWGKNNISNPNAFAGIAVFNGKKLVSLFVHDTAYRVIDLKQTKHSHKPFVIAKRVPGDVTALLKVQEKVLEALIEKGVKKGLR